MKTPHLLLLAAVFFCGQAVHAATSFPNVLSVGPFNNSPTYYYINTKIPFNPGVAPQIRITGYMYGGTNKAMDVRLGWYMWNNAFYWTQYHSELSFAKPSRIRLGTYDDAGTTRVRIEIANDGVYWTSYFISATDILGNDPYYTGWSYVEGAMPGSTGLVTEVPLQGDVQISGNLTAANFANGTVTGSASGLTLNAGGTNQNITLTPSGTGKTIINGNVGIGTPSPSAKLQVGSWTRIKDGTWADPLTPNAVSAGERLVFYEGGGWKTGIGMGGQNDIWFQAHTPGGQPAFRWFTGGSSAVPMERMRIMESGNVGIGTAAPNQQLSVNGNLSVGSTGSFIMMGESAYTGGGGYIFLKSTGNYGRDFNIQNYSTAAGWRTNLLVAGESGNVGIGNNSPAELLSVGSNSDSPNIRIARWAYLGQEAGHLTTVLGGNVKASGSSSVVAESTVDGYRAIRMKYDEGITFHTYQGSVIAGSAIGDERVRITPAGNVGIGTTTPSEPLEIAGTGRMFLGDGGGAARKGLLFDTVEDGTYVRLHAYNYGSAASLNLVINPYGGGNVGIGTFTPTHKLAVNGTIRAKEIIVDTNWADYVFDESYNLAPLSDVEAHIKAKKHLPGIPSAAEIAEHGVSMGDMQSKLLSKIEELTLHMIAQEKQMLEQEKNLSARIERLEQENRQLRTASATP